MQDGVEEMASESVAASDYDPSVSGSAPPQLQDVYWDPDDVDLLDVVGESLRLRDLLNKTDGYRS
jgi:hypothetical protein